MDVLFDLHYTYFDDDDFFNEVSRVQSIVVPHAVVQEASAMAVFQYAMRQSILFLQRMGHDSSCFDYLELVSW